MALTLAKKHCFTWKAITDVLKLLNFIFNFNLFPASKYRLFKIFPQCDDDFHYHFYCPLCSNYAGKREKLSSKKNLICSFCEYEIKEQNWPFF